MPHKRTSRRDLDGSGTVLTSMSDRSMMQSSQSSTFAYPAPLHDESSEEERVVRKDKSQSVREVSETESQRRRKSHTRRSKLIDGPIDASSQASSKRRSRSRRTVKDESSVDAGSRRSKSSRTSRKSRRSLQDESSTTLNSSRRSRKSSMKDESICEHDPEDKRQTMKRADSFAVRVSASRKNRAYLQLSDSTSMSALDLDFDFPECQ